MLIDDISIEMVLKDGSVEVVSSKDRLLSFNARYEADTDLEGVVGQISANELNISLLNDDNKYSIHNNDNVGVGVTINVRNKGVLFGSFIVTTWSSPRGGNNVVNIRATDRLQVLLNSPITALNIDKGVVLYNYIISVFNGLGVHTDDILIDDALRSKTIRFTISEGYKLSSLLNDIALSYDLYVYINKDNKIVIRSKDVDGDVAHILSDSINVYHLETKDDIEGGYNTLNINYNITQLSDVVDVLTIKELNVPVGLYTTDIYTLDNNNLYNIDNVKVEGRATVDIEGVKYSKSGVQLNLNNTSTDDKLVDVIVRGRNVDIVSVSESVSSKDIDVNGVVALDVDVVFIQSKEEAVILRDKLWGRLQATDTYVRVDVLSNNFIYNICDICSIDIKSEGITYKGYIHSIFYKWSGGDVLRCELGIKLI